MGLINMTRITDNLSVVIGNKHVDVIATDDFAFDVKVKFIKIDKAQLDNEASEKVFSQEYQLALAAVCKKSKVFFESEDEINSFTKQLKEVKELFKFAKLNKQNWFDTALFEGVLSREVGAL